MPRKSKAKSPDWFEIPIFSIPIYGGKLALCMTREEWAALAESYGGDPETENTKGLAIQYRHKKDGRVYAIGVFDGTADTFMHELAHATFFVLGDVGVTLEDGGANEAYTYLIGWFVREVWPVYLAATK